MCSSWRLTLDWGAALGLTMWLCPWMASVEWLERRARLRQVTENTMMLIFYLLRAWNRFSFLRCNYSDWYYLYWHLSVLCGRLVCLQEKFAFCIAIAMRKWITLTRLSSVRVGGELQSNAFGRNRKQSIEADVQSDADCILFMIFYAIFEGSWDLIKRRLLKRLHKSWRNLILCIFQIRRIYHSLH